MVKTTHLGEAPLVSICVIAFNQSPFISQTIESILSQETSFGIEILIHDDASTDGTTEIIRDYERRHPDLIRSFCEIENQWGSEKYRDGYELACLIPAARGKYIATCEGDDCWLDTRKLQKQAEYLEQHDDVSFVCHAAKVVDGTTGEALGVMGMGAEERDLPVGCLVRRWGIPTASRMYRKDTFDGYGELWGFDKPVGDFPKAVYAALRGTIHYVPEEMSLYRYRVPGSWTSGVASRKKAASNAWRWISMCENIDGVTGGRWHDDFVYMAKGYVRKILEIEGGIDKESLSLFEREAMNRINACDRIKVFVKRMAYSFGYEIAPTSFGFNLKRRIVRTNVSDD